MAEYPSKPAKPDTSEQSARLRRDHRKSSARVVCEAYIFWKSGRATEARDLRMAKELQLRKLRGQQLVRGPDAGGHGGKRGRGGLGVMVLHGFLVWGF